MVVTDTVLVTTVAVRDRSPAEGRNRHLLSYFLSPFIAGLGFLVVMSPGGFSPAGRQRDGSTSGNCFFFINFPAEGNQTGR
jgi:hypothetical protein